MAVLFSRTSGGDQPEGLRVESSNERGYVVVAVIGEGRRDVLSAVLDRTECGQLTAALLDHMATQVPEHVASALVVAREMLDSWVAQ